MEQLIQSITRPKRWAIPFDTILQDKQIDRLLGLSPFREMDALRFSPSTPLRDIIRNDTRIRKVAKGELVVREGDYGNSAFLVLKGTLWEVLSPGLPPSVLGRRTPARKGIAASFLQLFRHSYVPEARALDAYASARENASRTDTP
ncbi:MAG: oxidoreductase, partial [Verrucomicrobia bacterium]|nr:oxidoreductase [Verrucomicrobiota bacterium]